MGRLFLVEKGITRYSLRIAPINDEEVRLAGCKAYKNKPYPILLTLYGPRKQLEKVATDLMYSVHKDPSRQKVASI